VKSVKKRFFHDLVDYYHTRIEPCGVQGLSLIYVIMKKSGQSCGFGFWYSREDL